MDGVALAFRAREGVGAHAEVARLLVANGADVNAPFDADENTLLHMSCTQSVNAPFPRTQLPALLIELGADIHAVNADGATPLHCAAWCGVPDDVRTLVEAGGDVNKQNHRGQTPLHLAVCFEDNAPDLSAAEILLDAGSSLLSPDCDGKTPLHLLFHDDAVMFPIRGEHNTFARWTLLFLIQAWRPFCGLFCFLLLFLFYVPHSVLLLSALVSVDVSWSSTPMCRHGAWPACRRVRAGCPRTGTLAHCAKRSRRCAAVIEAYRGEVAVYKVYWPAGRSAGSRV